MNDSRVIFVSKGVNISKPTGYHSCSNTTKYPTSCRNSLSSKNNHQNVRQQSTEEEYIGNIPNPLLKHQGPHINAELDHRQHKLHQTLEKQKVEQALRSQQQSNNYLAPKPHKCYDLKIQNYNNNIT
ncbi:hypothetical protein, partial [Salmonella sp. s51228]|uniref:hypothetical protein n=1 Tax=Salmonella sp. s51228 TaxID=3159652 RepID=UPI0039805325